MTVNMKEEYKKKTTFEGNLIGRKDGQVILSMKGRLIKLPCELILEVRLPKPKFEPEDAEIRKLKL